MQQQSSAGSASDSSPSTREAQLEDLHRRIETLEALDESELGEFSRADWVLCIVGSIVIPSLVLLWFGR